MRQSKVRYPNLFAAGYFDRADDARARSLGMTPCLGISFRDGAAQKASSYAYCGAEPFLVASIKHFHCDLVLGLLKT